MYPLRLKQPGSAVAERITRLSTISLSPGTRRPPKHVLSFFSVLLRNPESSPPPPAPQHQRFDLDRSDTLFSRNPSSLERERDVSHVPGTPPFPNLSVPSCPVLFCVRGSRSDLPRTGRSSLDDPVLLPLGFDAFFFLLRLSDSVGGCVLEEDNSPSRGRAPRPFCLPVQHQVSLESGFQRLC